jgi:hypothetical protein
MRISSLALGVLGGALASLGPVALADVVQLNDGKTIEGKYAGGTATTVNIQTAAGVLAVPTSSVALVKFSPAAAAAPAPVPAAPPAAANGGAISVPAGSVLVVRMDGQVTSQDPAGKKFSGKLVADLMAGTTVVAKAGTTVLGQVDQSKQAGRAIGKSQLAISLVGIDFGGTLAPIMTTNFAETGKSSFRKTARNATAGALIGNAVDDDGGAGKGAAIGAGVSLIRKGDSVTVPPGAILEFRLTQPLNVTVK